VQSRAKAMATKAERSTTFIIFEKKKWYEIYKKVTFLK